MRLYTIKDRVADECGPVITAKNDAVATRVFIGLIADAKDVKTADFDLLYLGDFDNVSGKITGTAVPCVVSIKFGNSEVEDDE